MTVAWLCESGRPTVGTTDPDAGSSTSSLKDLRGSVSPRK